MKKYFKKQIEEMFIYSILIHFILGALLFCLWWIWLCHIKQHESENGSYPAQTFYDWFVIAQMAINIIIGIFALMGTLLGPAVADFRWQFMLCVFGLWPEPKIKRKTALFGGAFDSYDAF